MWHHGVIWSRKMWCDFILCCHKSHMTSHETICGHEVIWSHMKPYETILIYAHRYETISTYKWSCNTSLPTLISAYPVNIIKHFICQCHWRQIKPWKLIFVNISQWARAPFSTTSTLLLIKSMYHYQKFVLFSQKRRQLLGFWFLNSQMWSCLAY